MITIFTPFADRLNLNGDQGNVLVLLEYLKACGVEVRQVQNPEQLGANPPHFVLLGHGSKASMASIKQRLEQLKPQLQQWQRTVLGLAVGSSVLWLVENGLSPQRVNPGPQESEFVTTNFEGSAVLGYRNTDSGLANLSKSGEWIETMLHGPVLAKNPVLLRSFASNVLKAANLDVESCLAAGADWLAEVARINAQIWKLESQEEMPAL